jgi:hypothetical protein
VAKFSFVISLFIWLVINFSANICSLALSLPSFSLHLYSLSCFSLSLPSFHYFVLIFLLFFGFSLSVSPFLCVSLSCYNLFLAFFYLSCFHISFIFSSFVVKFSYILRGAFHDLASYLSLFPFLFFFHSFTLSHFPFLLYHSLFLSVLPCLYPFLSVFIYLYLYLSLSLILYLSLLFCEFSVTVSLYSLSSHPPNHPLSLSLT